ncbi:MAG: hypothetical protein COS49_00570 [Candidatus Portnoybacteria bacterium CG03_land_8_20_14_0_80_41_10]|uniref:Type 4a pilus biogenesis protein PilO n=1 Tax=Candidatus Portnoybacteria bacterium CG03_land_8_20_14_0_80_41_10 TaxID=1974808 RepID=A0A2M7BV66_9BACT|nr:MAG: hypothetical protein COS49_00570 [Candidatus Portnoybacteria bacterium CG03_land_8_20_14_0_80_41_10]
MSKKSIIILISLIGGLALIFFSAEPFWSSVKILHQEIEQKKLEIKTTEEILDKTAELDQEYQDLKEEADKISLSLPKEEDIPYLLIQLENLASANGLLLEKIDFGQLSGQSKTAKSQSLSSSEQAKKIGPPFPSSSLNVKLNGSYDALKGYLASLENNIRSMDVSSISFDVKGEEKQKSSPSSSLDIFEFDLNINIYYQNK